MVLSVGANGTISLEKLALENAGVALSPLSNEAYSNYDID